MASIWHTSCPCNGICHKEFPEEETLKKIPETRFGQNEVRSSGIPQI